MVTACIGVIPPVYRISEEMESMLQNVVDYDIRHLALFFSDGYEFHLFIENLQR